MEEQFYHDFFEIEERHWWFVARKKIVESFVRDELRVPAGARVLDVGCGTGAVLKGLSKEYDAYGTDTSELAVEYCRKRGLTNVFQCTLETFPHHDLRFRLITMLDVIEHIEDDRGVLAQARVKLDESGVLLVTVPAYQWLWSRHDELNHHQRRYTRSLLREALVSAGFVVERISYFNTLLFPLALVQRLLSKLLPSRDDQMSIPPSALNRLFERIFTSERSLLRLLSFPFGLSLIAVARPK